MTKPQYGYGHPFNYRDKPVAKYVEHFAELAATLPKGLCVTDLFSGVGTLANRLWPVLEPRGWVGVELDPDCIKAWEGPEQAILVNMSAFDVRSFTDLVIMDPHKGTLNAMAKDDDWKRLFRAIVDSPARYILMQEYGAYWCHLPNQKKLYSDMFQGAEVSRKNYRQFFAEYMFNLYGFTVVHSRIGDGSCYYLMEVGK